MDLLQGVQDAADALPEGGDGQLPPVPGGGDFKMPPLEDLLKALENMEGLTEENKRELRENLIARSQAEIKHFPSPETLLQGGKATMGNDMVVLFGLIAFVGLIFAFFGYKLYKSLVERDRRREEKRRQKQQKKKK